VPPQVRASGNYVREIITKDLHRWRKLNHVWYAVNYSSDYLKGKLNL
jgi:hypothetical protein